MTHKHTPTPWRADFTKRQLISFLNGLPGFTKWPAWEIERHLEIHGLDYFQPRAAIAKAEAV